MDRCILQKLVGERKTIRQIAAEARTSFTNVRYWLRRHELHTYRGAHGRKPNDAIKPYCCTRCGEVDPAKFYGQKRWTCSKCHNQDVINRGRQVRLKAIEFLGSKCVVCGFDNYFSALEFHHLDPTIKDVAYRHFRGWAWPRVLRELAKCVLVCANCHAGIHSGHVNLRDVGKR